MLEDELFCEFGLTSQQYNVLRILKVAYPKSIATLTIANQLISRAPDITRMLDRLAANNWIERTRTEYDRRIVLACITPIGLALLKSIREPLRNCHHRQLGHLTPNDLESLSKLLQLTRAPHESAESLWK